MWLGAALVWSGAADKAIPFLKTALKLSPHDPMLGQGTSRLAEAHLVLGDFDTALEVDAPLAMYSTLVVASAYAGTNSETEIARSELLKVMPKFSCKHFTDNFPATDPKLREIYLDGLRKAGLPET